MKIVQKGSYNGDIIAATLENREIDNLELFLHPETSTHSDPLEIYRSDEGRDLLLTHLAQKSSIVILVDSDADGFTSGSIMYQYLDELDADVSYIVHDGKAHGLTDNVIKEVSSLKPNLLITPDSSSNDVEQIELLERFGIDVLVLDHHHVSNFTEKGVIVNNQLCPVTNRNFVGAGMVYKFIQGLDEILCSDYADNYLDLVAVGQIGDSSDISDPEIRDLVLTGINNIKNKFLKVAITQKLGFAKIAPRDLSFTVIPLINAVTRVGTIEERELLFEALCGIGKGRFFEVQKKKKNKDTGKFDNITLKMDLYEYGYDMCLKVKARQDAIVKKMVASLEKTVIDDTGIIIAFSDDNENPGVTGLIANKLVTKYEKPALLLNEQEETFTGSGRGHEKTLKDFREWCENSGLVEFAQGHDNAFGISIRKEKIQEFKEYSRKIEKQDTVYEVDMITDRPNKDICELIDNNKALFGGKVREPLIGIVNLTVPKRFISQKGSMLNIYSWGVTIVQFSTSHKLIEEIAESGDTVTFNIVGTYSVNDWGGRKNPQFVIKDIEVVQPVLEDEINEDTIIF